MGTAEVAMVVSSASALFTAANMVVSYRTFRRVRPSVKVRLWRTGVGLRERETKRRSYQFAVRLLNNGTTPVTVERIELCRYKSRYGRRRFELVKGSRFDTKGRWGDPPPVIPALDGTVQHFMVDQGVLSNGDHLRFRILLSNGRTAASPLLPPKQWAVESDTDTDSSESSESSE
ncbi:MULTISPECIES: hypothetical protein [unclassified Streptomyces]|uniref:hypothetical protein n=1 Tax=unclassified Streptomyces TaxID=2593676 RepID=UPI0023654961|nr:MULTISPECIES: hypothetical protein [unclassified Streptomyces]MDF3145547.1 hypothetical protein [Streptomyces sp. T21Q-yed]WDF43556.1 hypothetical protein PBV52_45665 [Streptomyces sp. T12]